LRRFVGVWSKSFKLNVGPGFAVLTIAKLRFAEFIMIILP
jgi:hypothetical protein